MSQVKRQSHTLTSALGVLVFYSKYLLPRSSTPLTSSKSARCSSRHNLVPQRRINTLRREAHMAREQSWLVAHHGPGESFDGGGPACANAQAPPMGTLWILTIVQLPLSRAVMALLGLTAWVYWTGYKISP